MEPTIFLTLISLIILLILLFPYEPEVRKKEALLKTIKLNQNKSFSDKVIQWIDAAFYDLLHFDKKDSAQKLFKELLYSVLIGIAIFLAGTMLKMV